MIAVTATNTIDVVEQNILAKTADEIPSRIENVEVRIREFDFVDLLDLQQFFQLAVVPVERDVTFRNEQDENDTGQGKYGKKSRERKQLVHTPAQYRSDEAGHKLITKVPAKNVAAAAASMMIC